jgi:tetratricopeptide (TPR) repeat protein
MSKSILVCLALVIGASWALADARQDCTQDKDADLRIRACTDVVHGDPSAAWAYQKRGIAYSRRGDYDKAIVDLAKAIEIEPGVARHYYNRGLALYEKGEYDQAIADYNRAIELDPNDAVIYP